MPTALHNIVSSGKAAASQILSESMLHALLKHPSTGSPRTSHEYRIEEEQDVVDYELAVRVLLDHGADPTIEDTRGRTPIDILRKRAKTLWL